MSQWVSAPNVGAFPPPPGIEANFVNPHTSTKSAIALHTICLFFVTACVIIRLYTRQFITHKLGVDDVLCVLAYALTIVFSTMSIIEVARGLGRHIWDVRISQIPGILEMVAYSEYIYLLLVLVVKLSCLLFYQRIFSPSRKMRWLILAGMCLIGGTHTGLFFSALFECIPVQKSWRPELQGHCLPPKGLPYASGAINVVSDIYVLVIPIPCIWELHMQFHRKLRLMIIFGLGVFACITSIIRLSMTSKVFSSSDRTWNIYQVTFWAVIEVNVGIICSCLLAFPAFLDKHSLYGFGSFLSKLVSLSTSRREKRRSQTDEFKKRHPSSRPSRRNRSDDVSTNEYSELSKDAHAIKLQTTFNATVPIKNGEQSRSHGTLV